MRFVSKNSNLMVVLKPGLPGSHLTGQQPVTGIYVRFQNGIVDVKDEKMIEQMKAHPAFEQDFIAVDEKELDPFAYNREDIEPIHFIKEIKYGHIDGAKKTQRPAKISPELQNFIKDEATNMAKAMLPGMMKEFLNQMKAQQEDPSMMKAPEEDVEVAEEEKTDTNVKMDKKPKGKIKKDETEDALAV